MVDPLTIEIRPAASEECDVLADIALAAKRSWNYPEPLLEQWRPQFTISPARIDSQTTWVAVVEGVPAGFGSVAPKMPYRALKHLWVLPAHLAH